MRFFRMTAGQTSDSANLKNMGNNHAGGKLIDQVNGHNRTNTATDRDASDAVA